MSDLRDTIANMVDEIVERYDPRTRGTECHEFADAILALPEMQARERVIEAARAWRPVENDDDAAFAALDVLFTAVVALEAALTAAEEPA